MKVFPLPVMPRSVWKWFPRMTLSASESMACGWSPVGSKSATTLNGGIPNGFYGPVGTCLR